MTTIFPLYFDTVLAASQLDVSMNTALRTAWRDVHVFILAPDQRLHSPWAESLVQYCELFWYCSGSLSQHAVLQPGVRHDAVALLSHAPGLQLHQITFALCTFIALRERYSECPAYSDIRCGSRQAVLWIQSNADFAGAGIAFAAISLRIFASILLERLFHTWKDYYAVLKINMDFAACCVAMFWGTWAAEDYALVAVLAAWFWLSGLMVKQLSTTVWVMFGQLAATTAIFIKDAQWIVRASDPLLWEGIQRS
eukprot:s5021_g2.t1